MSFLFVYILLDKMHKGARIRFLEILGDFAYKTYTAVKLKALNLWTVAMAME